jgi:predicted RNA-binding Zn-ribbon protein involved in translation (DUF1610 family)
MDKTIYGECPECGLLKCEIEIDAALFDYPCPRCGECCLSGFIKRDFSEPEDDLTGGEA